jgi:hypothetical protein
LCDLDVPAVVDNVKFTGLADRERDLIYVPYTQGVSGEMLLAVRSRSRDAAALMATLRHVVHATDSEMAIADVRPLATAASQSIVGQRYATFLLTILASR